MKKYFFDLLPFILHKIKFTKNFKDKVSGLTLSFHIFICFKSGQVGFRDIGKIQD